MSNNNGSVDMIEQMSFIQPNEMGEEDLKNL